MKTCNKCKQSKPLNDFYKKVDGRFGVQAVCKSCESIRVIFWQKKNTEKWIENRARIIRDPEKLKQISAEYYKKYGVRQNLKKN